MKNIFTYLFLILFIFFQAVVGYETLQKAEKNFQKMLDNQTEELYNKEVEVAILEKRIVALTEELEKEQTKRIEEEQAEERTITHSGNIMDIRVTHYSAEEVGNGTTASGNMPIPGYTVACNFLPLGTHVIIDGQEYEVQDTGGMGGNVVDIFVSSYNEAISKGTYYTTMEVLD